MFKRLAPPPPLTVSQWADEYRVLSKEASAEAGKWRTDRAEYQREIMDAISDPMIEKIVMMTSAQIGKSEILNNALGYTIDYDPSPCLMVLPTVDEAKYYSKERLANMIRDTPVLRGKVKDNTSKDSENTILHKAFPGGNLKLTGANSPAGLAGKPTRKLFADEIDRWPGTAGREGDPLNLAEKRTNNFWNRKKIFASTPTIKGESRIEIEYNNSSMEQYHLPCPECEKFQPLSWQQIRFIDDNYDQVTHECIYCQGRFGEFQWKASKGLWKARKKNRIVRGFHLNELYSPWRRWETIVEEFKKAKAEGPDKLKVWVNTSLGECWEVKGKEVEDNVLLDRRELYKAELPEGVLLLTASVDVQDNRLEIEVVGWGKGKESWGIEHSMLIGDPTKDDVWNQLDVYLKKKFSFEDGYKLGIACTCVDSGYLADRVYKFVKPREIKRIFAIKGMGGAEKPFISRPTLVGREKNVHLFTLGVDSGKETILSNLEVNESGPGYCHFPINPEKGYNENYFKGLTSEKRILKHEKGKTTIAWVKKPGVTRNEPFDLRNYNQAALEILNPNFEYLASKPKNNIYDQPNNTNKPKVRRRRVISKGIR